jgi:hypothetical protein
MFVEENVDFWKMVMNSFCVEKFLPDEMETSASPVLSQT